MARDGRIPGRILVLALAFAGCGGSTNNTPFDPVTYPGGFPLTKTIPVNTSQWWQASGLTAATAYTASVAASTTTASLLLEVHTSLDARPPTQLCASTGDVNVESCGFKAASGSAYILVVNFTAADVVVSVNLRSP